MNNQETQVAQEDNLKSSTSSCGVSPWRALYLLFVFGLFLYTIFGIVLPFILAATYPEKVLDDGKVPPVYLWNVSSAKLDNRIKVLSNVLQDNGYQVYYDGQPCESIDELDSTNAILLFHTDEKRIDYVTNDNLQAVLQSLDYTFCDNNGNTVELDRTIEQLMVLGYDFSIYPSQKMVIIEKGRGKGQVLSCQTLAEASVDIKDLVHEGDTIYKWLYDVN